MSGDNLTAALNFIARILVKLLHCELEMSLLLLQVIKLLLEYQTLVHILAHVEEFTISFIRLP